MMGPCVRCSVRRIVAPAIAATLAGLAVVSPAKAVDYDILITGTGAGSKLMIGGFSDESLTALLPPDQMRVFGGDVVGDGSGPYESEAPGEPGFRAQNQAFYDSGAMTPSGVYTALAASTPLTFNFQPITIGANTRNLYFWDGIGAVSFAPVGSNVQLGLTKAGGGGWTQAVDGLSNSVIAGNALQNTTPSGTAHTHLLTSIAQGGGAPDQGFYLTSLQLQMSGYTSSDPIFLVYGAFNPTGWTQQQFDDFDAAHGLAMDWVQVNVVPEPSTCALLTLTVAAVPFARRRWKAAKRS